MKSTTSAVKKKYEKKKKKLKPGPKPTGKKTVSYFLTAELIETIAQHDQPSVLIENTMRKRLKMKEI